MTERNELAEFLRARREQLQPADVGLRDSGRRRTPGLRREEVATIAGVSVDYLIRLEQGRDIHPSPSVVMALATALQLTEGERFHLAKLAAISGSREFCPGATALVADVAPTVQMLVDGLHPQPTFVMDPINNVLSWNRAWQRLVQPMGFLDHHGNNIARFVFTDARARVVFPDWPHTADEQVSRLRAASLRWGEDPQFLTLVEELNVLQEFRTRWAAHAVSEKRRGLKRIVHPTAGDLRLNYEVLHLPDDGEQRLVAWLPADPATEATIRAIVDDAAPAGPPQLRVVREA